MKDKKWETETDVYTLLRVEWVTKENLPRRAEMPPEHSVGPDWGGNPGKGRQVYACKRVTLIYRRC